MAMTRIQALTDTALRAVLTALLFALAAYGLWSTPALVAHRGASLAGVLLLLAWIAAAGWAFATTIRMPRRGEWLAFTALALALRIVSAVLAAPRISPGDSHWYIVLAQHLLAGQGLVMVEPYIGVPARALYPPLYPLLLAGWGAIAGFGPAAILILSTAIDLAAAWAIIRLGALLDARRAGIAAACVYLVAPPILFSAALAQKEGLATFLIVMLAHNWIRAVRAPKLWRDALAIGLPAAALAMTQPGQAPLAVLFGLVLLPGIGVRRVLAIGVPAAAVAVAAMAPWWLRNWLVLGAFVPLTSSGGYSLWIGNNSGATGNWMAPPAVLHGLPELAFGHAAARIATERMAHHPVDVARITIAKFLRACGIGQFGVERLAAMNPPISAAIGALLLPVSHGAHLLLLSTGALALRLRRDPAIATLALLLAACVAQLMLFGVWFEFGERHREFLLPFLLVTVAVAVPHAARLTWPVSARGREQSISAE